MGSKSVIENYPKHSIDSGLKRKEGEVRKGFYLAQVSQKGVQKKRKHLLEAQSLKGKVIRTGRLSHTISRLH